MAEPDQQLTVKILTTADTAGAQKAATSIKEVIQAHESHNQAVEAQILDCLRSLDKQ